MLLESHTCRIGQKERCASTGCEWKKVFGGLCYLRSGIANAQAYADKVMLEQEKEKFYLPAKRALDYVNYKLPKKKKGRVVKDTQKYVEFTVEEKRKLKEGNDFSVKITTAKPDHWFSKIKTI